MTIGTEVALWAVGVTFFTGAFHAVTLWRLGRIEKALFNGQFVSKNEIKLRVEQADEDHERFAEAHNELEKRVRELEMDRS